MTAQRPLATSPSGWPWWSSAVLVLASMGLAACATPRGPRPGEPVPEAPPPAEEAPRPTAEAGAQPPSLKQLSGTEWVLRQWDAGEPAPREPAVTLRLEEGRFVGRGGCNQYSAAVTEGDTPGTLTVGSPMATKMLCRPPQMQVEMRYLEQLPRVHAFALSGSGLALAYEKDGASRVMRFEPREAQDAGKQGTPGEGPVPAPGQ